MTRSAPRRLALLAVVWLGIVAAAQAQPTFPRPRRYEPTAGERATIEQETRRLADAIAGLPADTPRDALADVAVFHRAAVSVVKLGEFYEPGDVATTLRVLERGRERARQLAGGKRPWVSAPGTFALGFVSRVDDTSQPCAVVVPE